MANIKEDIEYKLPEVRGKGISKVIVKYIFDYFLGKGLNKSKVEKNLMFLVVTL